MSYPEYPPNGPEGPASNYPAPPPYTPGYGENEVAPPSRPAPLVVGCIMTWVGGGFGVPIGLTIALVSGQQDFQDELNLSSGDANKVAAVGIVLLVASALAIIFSLLAFLGHRWAAIALAVEAGLYLAVSIYGVTTSGQVSGFFGPVYSIVASGLILGGSKSWFDYKARR